MQRIPEIKSPLIDHQVNGLKKGTFAELYRSYSSALYSAINKVVKSTTLSEEVLQNTFVKIWKCRTSFDHCKETPFTWMLNIARNEALDTLRLKRQRQSNRTTALKQYSFSDSNPFGHLDCMEVRKLLYILSPIDRAVMELHFFRGYTCQQTADLLCLPSASVKIRMQDSFKVLKKALTEFPGSKASQAI